MAYFRLFSNVISARREKNTSNMAATVGDIMDDVTCNVMYALDDHFSCECSSQNHIVYNNHHYTGLTMVSLM
jgi:hypothetical protein